MRSPHPAKPTNRLAACPERAARDAFPPTRKSLTRATGRTAETGPLAGLLVKLNSVTTWHARCRVNVQIVWSVIS